jgi:hypothetical protein
LKARDATIILKDEIIKTQLKNNYSLIARKNFKRVEIAKAKNPSILRRVKFQIR